MWNWLRHALTCLRKLKILLQWLWEEKVPWDYPVPALIRQVWFQWGNELQLLLDHHILRCYFPKEVKIVSVQLHGFLMLQSVVYSLMVNLNGDIHTARHVLDKGGYNKETDNSSVGVVWSIPACSTPTPLQGSFHLPPDDVFAWSDSTSVYNLSF